MPALLINRRSPGHLRSIVIDDAAGIATLVDHLVSLGHRDLAHVAGPSTTDTGVRRLEGFRQSVRRHGLVTRQSWIQAAEYSDEGGYAAARTILASRRRPTAIVASTVAAAIGAVAALRDAGVAVPVEMSVAAYDDVPLARFLAPRLTAVEMPLRQMGADAVEMLLRLIAGERVKDVVVRTKPILNVRESTAPPPGRRG
jgi:LacI family transcriptional regulator, galactose operon repressor